MEMEKARGISVTSTALQFEYDGHVVNLVDTPGHSDFSEDTYRVLTAVDAAVMLIDAGKGLEPQTLKLFQVCKHRGIPVITVINKWDRPGRSALELLDEIEERIGLIPTPLYLPVGQSGDFRGLLRREDQTYIHFTRTAGGATIAPEEHPGPDEAAAPQGRVGGDGTVREVLDPFSAVVFKVQAGMDTAHRDRLAYMRIVSGVFERGMVVDHAQTGRPFATKYALTVFGRDRETVDTAFPGDIVGLVNATALGPGHTLYSGKKIEFPPIPNFAPELFAVLRARSAGQYKQFRKAMDQLESEGVVQVLRNETRGDA